MSKYYAMIDGERRGPFELSELAEAGVRPSTYVWCKGMADWEKAEEVADICRMYRNRLFDLMHPSASSAIPPQEDIKEKPQSVDPGVRPSRFSGLMPPGEDLPTIEEINSREDIQAPTSKVMPWAIFSILFFPPVGALAVAYAAKCKRLWREGKKAEAHDFDRSAKMCTGISFFLGLIFWSFIIRFV